jgi:hypothetical protein
VKIPITFGGIGLASPLPVAVSVKTIGRRSHVAQLTIPDPTLDCCTSQGNAIAKRTVDGQAESSAWRCSRCSATIETREAGPRCRRAAGFVE